MQKQTKTHGAKMDEDAGRLNPTDATKRALSGKESRTRSQLSKDTQAVSIKGGVREEGADEGCAPTLRSRTGKVNDEPLSTFHNFWIQVGL